MNMWFAGSAGRSILAQTGFLVFLVVGFLFTLAVGPIDILALSSLAFAVPYAILIWYSKKGKRLAFLASSVLSLVLLLVTPFTLTPGIDPVLIYETSLAAFLLVLVIYEGIVAYSETKSAGPAVAG